MSTATMILVTGMVMIGSGPDGMSGEMERTRGLDLDSIEVHG
jgi:hypothetical protein